MIVEWKIPPFLTSALMKVLHIGGGTVVITRFDVKFTQSGGLELNQIFSPIMHPDAIT